MGNYYRSGIFKIAKVVLESLEMSSARHVRNVNYIFGLLMCCVLQLVAAPVWALGFGQAKTFSALGQPLLAEIALIGTQAEIDSLKVGLASPDAFDKAGIYYGSTLSNLRFAVARNAQGTPIIKVTTAGAVQDPFLDFLLEGSWSGGQVVRGYTLLLDPARSGGGVSPYASTASAPMPEPAPPPVPATLARAPTPAPYTPHTVTTPQYAPYPPPLPQAAANQPGYPAPTTPGITPYQTGNAQSGNIPSVVNGEVPLWPPQRRTTVPTLTTGGSAYGQQAPRGSAAGAISGTPRVVVTRINRDKLAGLAGKRQRNFGGNKVRVVRGDTLSAIARANRVPGVSLEQMLVGIYRSNRSAFINNNLNLVRAGTVLTIPGANTLARSSRREARRVYRTHVAEWRNYRNQLAAAAEETEDTFAPTQGEEQDESASASGQISSRVDTKPDTEKGHDTVKVTPTEKAAEEKTQAGADKAVQAETDVIDSKKSEDVQTRIATLEGTLVDQQKLLSMRITELAKLQNTAEGQSEQKTHDFAALLAATQDIGNPKVRLSELEQVEELMQKELANKAEQLAKLQGKQGVESESSLGKEDVSVEKVTQTTPSLPPNATLLPPQESPEPKAEKKIKEIDNTEPVGAPDLFDDPIGAVSYHVNTFIDALSDLGGLFGDLALGVLLLPILLILLLVGAFIYLRKRKEQREYSDEEYSDYSSTSDFSDISSADSSMGDSDYSRRDSASPASVYQGRHEGEESSSLAGGAAEPAPLTDFSQAGLGSIDTDDVDPVAEADVYIAYGRDAQAEEILTEAMQRDPTRTEVHVKLLEIYSKRNMSSQFEVVASELYAQCNGTGEDWEKASEMGRSIDPDNPLYGGSGAASSDQDPQKGEVPEENSPLDFESAEPAAKQTGSLGVAAAAGVAAVAATGAAMQDSADNKVEMEELTMDFDVPAATPQPVAQDTPSSPPSAEVPLSQPEDSADDKGELEDLAMDFDVPATTPQPVAQDTPSSPPSAEAPISQTVDMELRDDDSSPAAEVEAAQPQPDQLLPESSEEEAQPLDLDSMVQDTGGTAEEPVSLLPTELDFDDLDMADEPEASPTPNVPAHQPESDPTQQPEPASSAPLPAMSDSDFSMQGTLIQPLDGGDEGEMLDIDLSVDQDPDDQKVAETDDAATDKKMAPLTGSVFGFAALTATEQSADDDDAQENKEQEDKAVDKQMAAFTGSVFGGGALEAGAHKLPASEEDQDKDGKDVEEKATNQQVDNLTDSAFDFGELQVDEQSADEREQEERPEEGAKQMEPLVGSLFGAGVVDTGDDKQPADEIAQETDGNDADVDLSFDSDEATQPDFDFGSINLDLAEQDASRLEADTKGGQWDEINTKLDLAKAYEEMGDQDGARELLQEVIGEGSQQQIDKAHAMLQHL